MDDDIGKEPMDDNTNMVSKLKLELLFATSLSKPTDQTPWSTQDHYHHYWQ